jgi:hypothetical protein
MDNNTYLVTKANITIKFPNGEILIDNTPVVAEEYSFSKWENDRDIAIKQLYKKIDDCNDFIKLLYEEISELKNNRYEDQFTEFVGKEK